MIKYDDAYIKTAKSISMSSVRHAVANQWTFLATAYCLLKNHEFEFSKNTLLDKSIVHTTALFGITIHVQYFLYPEFWFG